MKKSIRRIKLLLYILFSWFLVLPISYLLGKFFEKRYILFIGRDCGKFMDNVKYLYLYFLKKQQEIENNGLKILFLTEEREVENVLKDYDLPVVKFPSIEGIKVMLSTRLLIVDNWMWIKKLKSFFLTSVKKIQLWHGVGFKYIELNNKYDFNSLENKILSSLINRYPKYTVVISTSPFYTEHVFSKAFNFEEIWETGYPRNDVFFRDLNTFDLLFTDEKILSLVRKKKEEGFKIILYAPTFRDTGGDAFTDNILDVKRLDNFLQKIKTLMVIKFHPEPNFNYLLFEDCKNIVFYDNAKDVYPLLKSVDCLITDYSSIYMDYLLTDKPIIFFPYDLKKYITKDRQIQFDYNWITPGEKVFTQEELEEKLKELLVENIDNYKEKREEIRSLAFKFVDGKASERIFNKILRKLILR